VVIIARLEKGGGFLVYKEVKFVYRTLRDEIASLFREIQSKSLWERVVMGGSGKAE
jgi:hypothetical protein